MCSSLKKPLGDEDPRAVYTVAMLTTVLRWAETRRGFWASLLLLTTASAALRLLRITTPPARVFDEVYSPAFAWKFLRGESFFDVHPMLTQLPHALGLLLFGDTPLGWRFGPWLWGTLFVCGLGLLGWLLLERRLTGILAALLAALDVSFFVYGRTGLPDMFLLMVFVWALVLFFVSCRAARSLSVHLGALGSGILLGSLVATKWFGIGAIVFLWAWIGMLSRRGGGVVPRMRRVLWPVYFLLVPLLTYLLWLIPLVGIPRIVRPAVGEEFFAQPACVFGRGAHDPQPSPVTWAQRVHHWHCIVWNYHAYLDATHPYASPWWSWPILKHPVLFYLDGGTTPARQISATGNPALWWAGFVAVWLTLLSLPLRWAKSRASLQAGSPAADVSRSGVDLPSGHGSPPTGGESEGDHRSERVSLGRASGDPRDAAAQGGPATRDLLVDLWLLLGIFGFWLPWVFIQRVTFHYHYFLSFTLTVLLLAVWLTRLADRRTFRPFVFAFLLLAFGAFVYLYPTATATSAFWVR